MSEPRKTVLLVDDEPRVLSGLRRRLMTDFDLITAERGREALEIVKHDPSIAVVVADMQMPEMNGIELLKQLKELRPEIRRLMLTGNSDQETAVAAINEGEVLRFMRKPCDADELKSAIHQALDDYAFIVDTNEPKEDKPQASAGDKARDAFLSVMNEELKTPLNHIIGFSQLLETATDAADAPDNLRHIRDSGQRMLVLIDRMLEFARLASEEPDTEGAHLTDLVAIANDEVGRARRGAQQKRVTISVEAHRRRAHALAKESEVRLALRELINNAVKFNSVDGHVSVIVRTEPKAVMVLVADTGCGVSEQIAKGAGEPFFVGDDGLTRRHDGVGLGLALVATVAKLNRARFLIQSRNSGGAAAVLSFRRPVSQTNEADEDVQRVSGAA